VSREFFITVTVQAPRKEWSTPETITSYIDSDADERGTPERVYELALKGAVSQFEADDDPTFRGYEWYELIVLNYTAIPTGS
jgi:hypothetical protein